MLFPFRRWLRAFARRSSTILLRRSTKAYSLHGAYHALNEGLFARSFLSIELLETRWMPTTVHFTASTANVGEAAGTAALTVDLDAASSNTITVDYTTANGTATAGSDYTSTSGTLTFDPFVTQRTINVTISNDALDEDDETFTATLSNATNATIDSPSTTTVTIQDNDATPTISWSTTSPSVAENAGKATLTVNLSAASGRNVSFDFATSDGTAVDGKDYTAGNGVGVTFTPGQTSKTFDVYITDDEASESSEDLSVTLSNATNATISGSAVATLTITNVSPSGWYPTGQRRLDDPVQAGLIPYGPLAVSPQTGGLVATEPVDVNKSVASEQDAWSQLAPSVALIYRSETANPKPIIELTWPSGSSGTIPSNLNLQLTWNGGSAQTAVNYTVSGHSQGDTYVVAVQHDTAVTSSGRYSWSVQLKATFTNRGQVLRAVTGETDVQVNGTSGGFGVGWNLTGLNKLTSLGDNKYIHFYGSGGHRAFPWDGEGGPAQGPDNELGKLYPAYGGGGDYIPRNNLTYHYSSDGTLATITDLHGLVRSFTYSSGLLTKIEEPDGGVTTFSYNGSNLLDKITQPGNRVVTITHDGSGNLTAITRPDGALETFTYDGNSRMTNHKLSPLNATVVYDATSGAATSINRGLGSTLTLAAEATQALQATARRSAQIQAVLTDALSYKTTMTLDSLGRQTQVQTPDGVTTNYTLNAAGQVTVASRASQTTTYAYTGGDMTQKTAPEGNTQTLYIGGGYTYGNYSNHQPDTSTDSLSNVTSFTYHSTTFDRTVIQNALNERTTFTWSSGLLESIKDALNRITTFQYDGSRRLQNIINALGDRTTFTHDSSGNVATIQDALGRVTTRTYDAMRRLLTETNAAGGVVTVVYNMAGLETSRTDQAGRQTQTTYDQRGWATAVTQAVGTSVARTLTNVYDALGRVTQKTDALNHTRTMTYDAMGRVLTETSPVGGVTTFAYDSYGNRLTQTDPLGHTVTATFDGLNRQVTTKDAAGTSTVVYDSESNVLARIDPLNRRTTMTYDVLNRMQTIKDALSNVATVVYDAVGNRQALVNPLGNRVTFTFDALNRQTAQTDQLSHTITSVFDAVGNVIRTVDAAGKTTTMTYDSLNRRITTQDPGGGVVTTTFDSVGNVRAI